MAISFQLLMFSEQMNALNSINYLVSVKSQHSALTTL
jgi:hypothetical protein